MSYEEIKKRPRATSAKVSRQRLRPSSGKSQKNKNVADFIDNMYGGIVSMKKHSRHIPSKIGNFGDQFQPNKFVNTKIYKQKEQLLDQTIKLKRQINSLKNELNTQKSRTEQMRRKNSDFTKKINVQFEKQLYWNGSNANMVRGVKNQYEQLKLKYEQKCQQYDQMAKELISTQSKQDKSYIQILQRQNLKLKRRLIEAQQQMRLLSHGTITSKYEEQTEKYKQSKFELYQQNEFLRSQLQQIQGLNKIRSLKIKQLEMKMQHMDKLLIERDNNQHNANRRYKKTLLQKQNIAKQVDKLKNQKQSIINKYQTSLHRIRQTLEIQSQTQRVIFMKELTQKTARIDKLQKQIAYLTTLMSYWKPIDQINHFANGKANNSSLNLNLIKEDDDDRQISLEYSMGSTVIKNNLSKNIAKSIRNNSNQHLEQQVQSKFYMNKSKRDSVYIDKSRRGSLQSKQNIQIGMTKSIDLNKNQNSKRTQITADKRNSQQGVKCRKVAYSEIIDICQTLKYRFIGQGLPIQQVKKLFDYNFQTQVLDTPEQQQWRKQYINMRQVKEILQSSIFNLDQEDSQLFSRYLIQDSANDHVYCDPNNQHLRTVVKSIIKTSIGQYSLVTNEREIAQAADQLVAKYETNLRSALSSIASKGIISKKKLLELIKGLGIEMPQYIEDYIIGKLVLKSHNLQNLKYNFMFKS